MLGGAMSEVTAFVSPEYPVLYTVREGDVFDEALPADYAAVSLAVLVRGLPSFLATHVVDRHELADLRQSLDSGDVRVAVVGLPVEVDDLEEADLEEGGLDENLGGDPLAEDPLEDHVHLPDGEKPERPAAFVSLICADGHRLSLARILGREEGHSPEDLARYIIKEIARGVQVPDLAAAR